MRIFLKFTSIAFVGLFLLIFSIIYIGNYYLETNLGFKYESIHFNIEKVKISGIDINNSQIHLNIEDVEFDLKWRQIWKFISNRTGTKELNYFHLNGLNLEYLTGRDTIKTFIDNAEVYSLHFKDDISIDRILINISETEMILNGDSMLSSEGTSSFDFNSLPGISINQTQLTRSKINLRLPKDTYTISNLNFNILNINTADIMSASLDTLGFLYSDSLLFSSSFKKAQLFEDFKSVLNNFIIDVDGFRLNISKAELLDIDNLEVKIDNTEIAIQLKWLRLFLPNFEKFVNAAYPDNTWITLSGGLNVSKNSIESKNLLLSIGSFSSVFLEASFDYSDSIYYNFKKFQIKTTGVELQRILPFNIENEISFIPEKINISGKLYGDNKLIKTEFDLISPEYASIAVAANYNFNNSFKVGLEIKKLYPNRFLKSPPISIDEIVGRLEMVKYEESTKAILELTPTIEGEKIDNIKLWLSEIDSIDSLNIQISDNLGDFQLTAGMPNRDLREIIFNSAINLTIPTFLVDFPFKAIKSKFDGNISLLENAFTLNLSLDSLSLLDSDSTYQLNSSMFSYTRETLNSNFSFMLKNGQNGKVEFDNDIEDLKIIKINEAIKSAEINFWTFDEGLSIDLDSIKFDLNIDTLVIKKSQGKWSGFSRIPSIIYNEFTIENFNLDFKEKEDLQELALSTMSLRNKDYSIDTLDVKLVFQKSNFECDITGYINGYEERISIPLSFNEYQEGYLLRFKDNESIDVPYLKLKANKDNGVYLDSLYNIIEGNVKLHEKKDTIQNFDFMSFEIMRSPSDNYLGYFNLAGIDLNHISNFIELNESLRIDGKSEINISFTIDDQINYEANLILSDTEIKLDDPSFHFHSLRDTISLSNNELILKDITVYDPSENIMIINGKISNFSNPIIDISVKSENFQLLNSENSDAIYYGDLLVDKDIRITGDTKAITISGHLDILPGAKFTYNFGDESTVIHSQNAVSFIEFDKLEENFMQESKSDIDINWDLDLKLNSTETEIIISKVTQEFIRINSTGELKLKNGIGNRPAVFGKIESDRGRSYIEVPGVPNLNLLVDKIEMFWEGPLDDPLLNFKGHEVFKVIPSGLSENFSSYGVEDFLIYLELNNSRLDQLEVKFDLGAKDSSIDDYLKSLPADTRNYYALNLLIFGSFEIKGSEKGLGYSMMASKMNEIARRNLKNADLYFSADKRNDSDDQARTDLNYNLSKGFFKDKLTINLSGGVQIESNDSQSQKTHILDDIEINYLIKEQPRFSLKAARKFSERGITQDRIETSVGFNFRKKFGKVFGLK